MTCSGPIHHTASYAFDETCFEVQKAFHQSVFAIYIRIDLWVDFLGHITCRQCNRRPLHCLWLPAIHASDWACNWLEIWRRGP